MRWLYALYLGMIQSNHFVSFWTIFMCLFSFFLSYFRSVPFGVHFMLCIFWSAQFLSLFLLLLLLSLDFILWFSWQHLECGAHLVVGATLKSKSIKRDLSSTWNAIDFGNAKNHSLHICLHSLSLAFYQLLFVFCYSFIHLHSVRFCILFFSHKNKKPKLSSMIDLGQFFFLFLLSMKNVSCANTTIERMLHQFNSHHHWKFYFIHNFHREYDEWKWEYKL